jgi:hypothetical protein
MGCGCKKKKTIVDIHLPNNKDHADPEEWGPILWNALHCIAERIGTTGSKAVDTDQARAMEYVVFQLATILPCKECQQHYREYLVKYKPTTWIGLYGEDLRATIRTWLFTLHNSVRQRTNKPIIVSTAEDCQQQYAICEIKQCEIDTLIQNINFAIMNGWIRREAWKQWFIHFNRTRILVGLPQ